jgi:hypothetical protein
VTKDFNQNLTHIAMNPSSVTMQAKGPPTRQIQVPVGAPSNEEVRGLDSDDANIGGGDVEKRENLLRGT